MGVLRALASRRRVACAALAGLTLSMVALSPAHGFDTTSHTRFAGAEEPMGQTNGPVWTVQIAGGHVFAGGKFSSTRPAGAAEGTAESGQAFLAAFDANTGKPWPGFSHQLANDYAEGPATVFASALSPDGQTLYVGGDFNVVDGVRAEHLAAFDTGTGRFKSQVGWNGVNGSVRSLAVSPDGTTLYVGGTFSKANWTKREHLAAFDLRDGSLLAWSPSIGSAITGQVLRAEGLAVSADGSKVFVAGPFS
jgi:DNA-binding beta-propeller fold protein YncE